MALKTIILCGGQGTRLRQETEYKPKPMVNIGGKLILWHIMKIYAHYGFLDFVLALGYKGNAIRDYFLNYDLYAGNFTIKLGVRKKIEVHSPHSDQGWRITMVETGENNLTGSRIKQCEEYIDDDIMMVTYGDGVSNINIRKLLEFHKSHGRMGTITGVSPTSRWGELKTEGDRIISFTEKPKSSGSTANISGGFMIFNREVFKLLSRDESCVFEHAPLSKLAQSGELMLYHHDGFWAAMDTYRDYLYLNTLASETPAPWFCFDD